MKTKYTIIELKNIEKDATILRACNLVPFDVANKINGLSTACKVFVKEFDEKIELLKERKTEATNMPDETAKKEAIKLINEDGLNLYKEKFDVDFKIVPLKDFEGIQISGEKETIQPNGTMIKFGYRDAFYDLKDIGLIA
jgi:hypothetical protein